MIQEYNISKNSFLSPIYISGTFINFISKENPCHFYSIALAENALLGGCHYLFWLSWRRKFPVVKTLIESIDFPIITLRFKTKLWKMLTKTLKLELVFWRITCSKKYIKFLSLFNANTCEAFMTRRLMRTLTLNCKWIDTNIHWQQIIS